MGRFLLVHGAWHGGWCWSGIQESLQSRGHNSFAPDLPGHGPGATPMNRVTLPMYVKSIVELLDKEKDPVILVGHSMGGLVISEAAEQRPEKIERLVYVCAFLLRSGETLAEIAQQDTRALVMPNLVVSDDTLTAFLKPEVVRETFYARCQPDVAVRAQRKLVPQALSPFVTPLSLSNAGFGMVPKTYVECSHDRAISIEVQQQMNTRTKCEEVIRLESDHSPFLSCPDELTSVLCSCTEN